MSQALPTGWDLLLFPRLRKIDGNHLIFCNNYTETSNFFENIYIVSLLNWIPNDIDSEYEISNKLMQI